MLDDVEMDEWTRERGLQSGQRESERQREKERELLDVRAAAERTGGANERRREGRWTNVWSRCLFTFVVRPVSWRQREPHRGNHRQIMACHSHTLPTTTTTTKYAIHWNIGLNKIPPPHTHKHPSTSTPHPHPAAYNSIEHNLRLYQKNKPK